MRARTLRRMAEREKTLPVILEQSEMRQGRSQKSLRAVVRFVGGFYEAHWQGRREKYFHRDKRQALAN
jgi:hypothetical protein